MQQRPPSSTRSPDHNHEQFVVLVVQPHQEFSQYSPPPTNKAMDHKCSGHHLPVYSSQIVGKKLQSSKRSLFPVSEKWVHAIPVVIFLCFFFLWSFSHPVAVEIENGRITAINPIEKPLATAAAAALNDSHIDIAILMSANSPVTDSAAVNLIAQTIAMKERKNPASKMRLKQNHFSFLENEYY